MHNPLVFVAVVALVAFVVYQALTAFAAYVWPQLVLRLPTRLILGLAVAVAAAVAVGLHEVHVHSPHHAAELLEGCAEDPECARVLGEAR